MLLERGIANPEQHWGKYQFLKLWDNDAFRKSLERADYSYVFSDVRNRIIVHYSSLSDPYQNIIAEPGVRQEALSNSLRAMVRGSLKLILENSVFNVRILTRSIAAGRDFDLFQKFGSRLVLGMSLPTLQQDLIEAYEPGAPAVSERLKTLWSAKRKGIPIFVAISPIYPEIDAADLRSTFAEIAALDPVEICCEPINYRPGLASRLLDARNALELQSLHPTSEAAWTQYALRALAMAQEVATGLGQLARLRLMPSRELGDERLVQSMSDPGEYRRWLDYWWHQQPKWSVH